MTSLTYDEIFEAAAQIMLFIDRSITIHFTLNAVRIQFPTTRKLAEHLQMPHYYILPYFATMEKENVITRVERVGISTTQQGSRKLIRLMTAKYKKETEAILGASLLNELQQRLTEKEDEKEQPPSS
jgi:DNA-binding transcriptional regulator YhcF (GntR family)